MSTTETRDLATGVYDPARPVTRDYAHSGSFVSQELPITEAWRHKVPWLDLPETCTVRFYCETPDVPDRVVGVSVDLHPEINRGFTRVQFNMYDSVWLTRPDDSQTLTRMTCKACGSWWGMVRDTGYGSAFTCMDCGHDSYHDRGD